MCLRDGARGRTGRRKREHQHSMGDSMGHNTVPSVPRAHERAPPRCATGRFCALALDSWKEGKVLSFPSGWSVGLRVLQYSLDPVLSKDTLLLKCKQRQHREEKPTAHLETFLATSS